MSFEVSRCSSHGDSLDFRISQGQGPVNVDERILWLQFFMTLFCFVRQSQIMCTFIYDPRKTHLWPIDCLSEYILLVSYQAFLIAEVHPEKRAE